MPAISVKCSLAEAGRPSRDFAFPRKARASARLRRAGSFLFLAKKKPTKEKGPPRSGKLASCTDVEIFRHGIPAVAKNGAHPCAPPSGFPVGEVVRFKRKNSAPLCLPCKRGLPHSPVGRRAWMPAVFRPSHGGRVGKARRYLLGWFAVSGKAFFFGSFLLLATSWLALRAGFAVRVRLAHAVALSKRNEPGRRRRTERF